MTIPDDPRLDSPAAARNQAPILAALQPRLPARGVMIEIAAGSGQHAAAFAAALPGWDWWPTDLQPQAIASIDAWCAGLPNVRPAQRLDVTRPDWPALPLGVDALYCANMLHIAPWAACAGLMRGAARHLGPRGALWLYGPYRVDGEPTAPSNEAFDADLRARDPAWGLRRLEAVLAEAAAVGLVLEERLAMPANNLLVRLGRLGRPAAGTPAG